MPEKKKSVRKRQTSHKVPLADFLRRHSPIKKGVSVHDELPVVKYNKITDKIYIGNMQAAKDREFFKNKKIKAVLNCTKELDVPNHFAHRKDIEYMRIPVDDSLKEKDFQLMYEYMPCIVEFIHKHADIGKNNILVHCVEGKQRSAISVAAYLVSKHGMTPHAACKYILGKRPIAFHAGLSLNFDQALEKYYKTHKK